MATKEELVSAKALEQHSSSDDCWLLVNGIVWDLSEFAPEHPGGADSEAILVTCNLKQPLANKSAVIHRYAGKDASEIYNSIHAPSLLANELGPSKRKGSFDASSGFPAPNTLATPQIDSLEKNEKQRRSLHSIISARDFEQAASENLSEKAWAFFSSAATDCTTKQANERYFNRIWLRPQILKDVRDIRYNTKILGNSVDVPLFVSPTAMVRLSHPDGELAIARGCSQFGIVQTVRSQKLRLSCIVADKFGA
jgi:L-lactate dehydrogenase (cytochrome)